MPENEAAVLASNCGWVGCSVAPGASVAGSWREQIEGVHRLDDADAEHLLPEIVHRGAGELRMGRENACVRVTARLPVARRFARQEEHRLRGRSVAASRRPRRLVAGRRIEAILAGRVVGDDRLRAFVFGSRSCVTVTCAKNARVLPELVARLRSTDRCSPARGVAWPVVAGDAEIRLARETARPVEAERLSYVSCIGPLVWICAHPVVHRHRREGAARAGDELADHLVVRLAVRIESWIRTCSRCSGPW